MTFCDTTAETDVSVRTYGRTDERTERNGWTDRRGSRNSYLDFLPLFPSCCFESDLDSSALFANSVSSDFEIV